MYGKKINDHKEGNNVKIIITVPFTEKQKEQLRAQMRGADIVAMALPNTPQTYHIMSAERLAKMKPGSILLNVGRGRRIVQS